MTLQIGLFLLTLVVLWAPLSWSQVGSGDSSQSSSTASSQQQSADGPQPVFTHPEDLPPLAMLSEVTSHSFIGLGLGATVAYDTNAASFSYQKYSQTLGILNPSIDLRQTRPTLTWDFGASGGLTTSNVPGYYSSSNPSAHAGFLYQISQRWQLKGSDFYTYTEDPFQYYEIISNAPTYNQPNPTIYVPLTTTETNYGHLDLTYQFTAHDSLTFTGTENFIRYLHDTYFAYNQYSWGGGASYQHIFSARFAAGGSYNFSALDFGHGESRSGISEIVGFLSYKISPHTSVAGWVGPEYTSTKNVVPIFCTPFGCYYYTLHNSAWSTAFGATYSWNGVHNAANASFIKSITNGGIILGLVDLYQATGNFTRQLTARWNFNASILYGNNTGYSTIFHARHLDSLTGNVGLSRQLTPDLTASVQYLRIWETQKNIIGAAAPKWTDNRFQFTLQYKWSHSLGR
jgi:hypothetical protein